MYQVRTYGNGTAKQFATIEAVLKEVEQILRNRLATMQCDKIIIERRPQ